MSSRRIRKFGAGGLLKMLSPAAMAIDKFGDGNIGDALSKLSPIGLLGGGNMGKGLQRASPAMMALKAGEKSKKKKDGLS